MAKRTRYTNENFINRELSWLEFNDRVLREGCHETVPLMERLKFLAIVRSNLDEFFMVRVAGLMQQQLAGIETPDPSGLPPSEQLAQISKRAHRLIEEQTQATTDVLAQLAVEGLVVLDASYWNESQQKEIARLFRNEIAPVATPVAFEELPEPPLLANLQTYVGLLLEGRESARKEYESDDLIGDDTGGGDTGGGDLIGGGEADDEKNSGVGKKTPFARNNRANERRTSISSPLNPVVAVIPVPLCLPRFFSVTANQESFTSPSETLVAVEDVLYAHAAELFPGRRVLDRALFRITRDGNVEIHDDSAADLCEMINVAVSDRRRRAAVRLEISANASSYLRDWLLNQLGLKMDDCYPIGGFPDSAALFHLAGRDGYERLRDKTWNPEIPHDLPDDEHLWDVLRERDVLLVHPYESFDPVVRMVRQAAEDPDVLAIRQTLYRTSGDSPIVGALELAAMRGKDVTVLVELKARFDEARNVVWARRLEDAGCHVLYGIAGLKTHAKALLIVRREDGRLRRYLHLATGNYNDKTAKMYSDLGIMTTDRTLTSDVAAFFNLLTGCSDAVGWERITCEPVVLKQRFLELINREAELSTPDRPGWILAKMNALEDPEIIEGLYEANRRGVRILLNVRGICCLRPGVPGVSQQVEVRSIVDRYLEHSRIFCFSGGGHIDLYLASADWMGRNLERRFEMLFPITDPTVRRRIFHFLTVYFSDTTNSKILQSDGTWRPATEAATLPPEFVETDLPQPLRAQELFHMEAVTAARQLRSTMPRFRPLHSPNGN